MFIELYFIKAQFSDKHHYTEVKALVIIHIQFLQKMYVIGHGMQRAKQVCGVCMCLCMSGLACA